MREMFRTHISHRTLKQLRHTLSLNNGQTLVETALSIAALLMFIIGSAEIGLAAYSYHFISDASREATRYAIVRGSTIDRIHGDHQHEPDHAQNSMHSDTAF